MDEACDVALERGASNYYYAFEVNSIHNAGTIILRRRFVRAFFFMTSYTFSKTSYEGSEIAGGATGSSNGLQNIHCFGCMRGRADFDIPHAFTTNFSWVSPSRHMLRKGWRRAGKRSHLQRRRSTKGTVPNPSVSCCFDLSAFPAVPTNSFQFGNAGRGILDAPGRVELNSNFSRNFAIREKSNLHVRWEVFNALNHANFGLPVRTVDTSNAATLTGASNSRLMQFALRNTF